MLRGGYAHYEGQFFLVNYLDTRGLFSKIFSAHFNEWDCYQGRELSFLFGLIDAEVIRYSARAGWVHLYSATHFVGLFGLATLLWRTLPRIFPSLQLKHAGLIVVMLLTTPTAIFSGYYYRPAKILAAFFLVVVLWLIGKMRAEGWRLRPVLLISLCVAATLLGMSDRLGVYMLLLILIVLPIARKFDRASISIAGALLTALLLNVVWSTAIGPHLSEIADGLSPNTRDQIVHLRFTFLRSGHYGPALGLLTDHIEFFFGNLGWISLAGFLSVSTVILWRAQDRRLVFTFIVVTLATAAVYVAMYARLSSLPWPASRRVYYWLPQLVVFAFAAAVLVERSLAVIPRAVRTITPLLLLMIATNLLALPAHWNAIRSQEHHRWIAQSAIVRQCVGERARPISEFALDDPYAQLCGSLRAAAAGSVWDGKPSAHPNPQLSCRRSVALLPVTIAHR